MSTSDGRTLWRSLLQLPAIELATVLALFGEMKLIPLLWSRIRGDAGAKDFERTLEESAAQLSARPRPYLILSLLGRMTEVGGLPWKDFKSERDFEDQAAAIAARAIHLYRKHNKSFSGSSLSELLTDQLRQLVGGVEQKFDSLSPGEQEAFLDRMESFVESLPEEQRHALQEALGAEEISRSLLRRAVVAGTLSAALVATAQIGGFAFYTAAVSMLAGVAALFGITLPFAAYTGLTSALAVIVNPIFLLLMGTGFAYYLLGRGTHKLQEKLLPLVIVQLVARAQSPSSATESVPSASCLNDWELAMRLARDIHSRLDQARGREKDLRGCRSQLREEKKSASNRLKSVQEQIRIKATVAENEISLLSQEKTSLVELLQSKQKSLDQVEALLAQTAIAIRRDKSALQEAVGRYPGIGDLIKK